MKRLLHAGAAVAAALLSVPAQGGPVFLPQAASSSTLPSAAPRPAAPMAVPHQDRSWYQADADAYQMVSSAQGLSFHKPMYVLPATYSESYHGRQTEMIFQFSLKQRLFGIPLYLAYTQKSFWQAYNTGHSKPFRESDYNPEMFYRFIPAGDRWLHLGADIGIEHESNGQALPGSRSWNRIYLAPFQRSGSHLVYWKWWWRLPENEGRPRTDPQRDDNPDIGEYYGYSELTYERQVFARHMVRAIGRINPVKGRGSVNVQYTIPDNPADPAFFWMFTFFQGYGESLADYNHSITRVGFGIGLVR